MLTFFVLLNTQAALAVPLQVTQQGRILDSSGAALSSSELVVFRIYDAESGGAVLWDEAITVHFNNGYYATILGADEANNPLDSDTLSLYPLYLELQLNTNAPMSPRHLLSSTPYAQIAGVAESVDGGAVNASEVSIGMTPVIDSGGHWVGPSMSVDWSSVTNIPSDLADGDNDTQLSEVEVETMVTNDAIDLAGGSTVAGSPILTAADATTPDWTDVTNRPVGLDDGDDDTQLSEAEVEGMVTNGALSLASGTTIGGKNPVVDPTCTSGQILIFDAGLGSWSCGEDSDTTLTTAEMQTMIEAMTLNLQNAPQINGVEILTAESTLDLSQLDSSAASEGQVPTYSNGAVSWSDGAGGDCTQSIVTHVDGSFYVAVDCGTYNYVLKTGGATNFWSSEESCDISFIEYGDNGVHSLIDCGNSSHVATGTNISHLRASVLGETYPITEEFHCAINSNSEVECWGYDSNGQVSDVPSGSFTALSSGYHHVCGIKADESVACWGYDSDGQVSDAPSGSFTALSSGYHHTCGLGTDQAVACWGENISAVPSGSYTAISSGGFHACGIKGDQSVVCWGNNGQGQVSNVPSGSFTVLNSGNYHICGIKTDQSVACWGRDNEGQVSNAPSGSFTMLSSGYYHTCGIKADQSVVCWGEDSNGQISDTPSGSFTTLTSGYYHVCGLKTDQSVVCWGYDQYRQVSDTPTNGSWVAIQSSRDNNCGLLESGNVICWGRNDRENLKVP